VPCTPDPDKKRARDSSYAVSLITRSGDLIALTLLAVEDVHASCVDLAQLVGSSEALISRCRRLLAPPVIEGRWKHVGPSKAR